MSKKTTDLIDVKKATKKQLLKEYEICEKEWGKYSCDCFGFYMSAIHTEIVKRGGWPAR
jgi:hypothetical protein